MDGATQLIRSNSILHFQLSGSLFPQRSALSKQLAAGQLHKFACQSSPPLIVSFQWNELIDRACIACILCVLNSVRMLFYYLWIQLFIKNSVYAFKSYISCFKVSSAKQTWTTRLCQLSQVNYILYLSSWQRCQVACIRTWFSVVHGSRPEIKNQTYHSALCITSTRKYQICVSHDVWQKSESGGFSTAVWMCPCLSICLSWLSLSVPPVGCVCLPVSACFCLCLSPFHHFHNVSFSLDWSPSLSCLNQFPSLVCSLYFPFPSLLLP